MKATIVTPFMLSPPPRRLSLPSCSPPAPVTIGGFSADFRNSLLKSSVHPRKSDAPILYNLRKFLEFCKSMGALKEAACVGGAGMMIFQSGGGGRQSRLPPLGSIKVLPGDTNVARCVFSASRARKRGASTSCWPEFDRAHLRSRVYDELKRPNIVGRQGRSSERD